MHGPQRHNRRAPSDGRPLTNPLGQKERRVIFQEMVKAELEAGLLRNSKRRRLVRFAARMGLEPFEANLIIAQVQHAEGTSEPPRMLTKREIQDKMEEARRFNERMRNLLIAVVSVAALNLAIIHWALY